MEIDKPTSNPVPGPSFDPSPGLPLGPCSLGPSPDPSSAGSGNGALQRQEEERRGGEGKKNAKKRHSFTALSVTQRTAQLNNRHSMEISHPVLISSSDPRAAARIQDSPPGPPGPTPSSVGVLVPPRMASVTSELLAQAKVQLPLNMSIQKWIPGLIAQHRCPTSLMLLWLNGSKSLQQCSNIYHLFSQMILNDVSVYPSYLALYAYKSQKADELELRKGEMYRVTEKCQDGWFKGTSLRTAASGVFPGNYVTPVSRIIGDINSILVTILTGLEPLNLSPLPTPSPTRALSLSRSLCRAPFAVGGSQSSCLSGQESAAAQLKNCLRFGQQTVNQTRSAMQLVHSPPSSSPERPTPTVSPLRPQKSSPSRSAGQSARPISMVSPGPSPLSSPASRPLSCLSSTLIPLSSPLSCLTPPNASAALLNGESTNPFQPSSPGPSHSNAPKPEKPSVVMAKRFHSALPPSPRQRKKCSNPNLLPAAMATHSHTHTLKHPPRYAVLPRVPAHRCERALGMLQGGMRTADVTRAINCNVSTVRRLRQSYRETGRTADRPRSRSSPDNTGNNVAYGHKPTVTGPDRAGKKCSSLTSHGFVSPGVMVRFVFIWVIHYPQPSFPRYRVVVPYPPQSEAEIELRQGDVVFVHKKREDGWYKGTLQRTGRTGLFPGSFVEIF
ncbi:unnamed protein product [Oncorhynchus mykiss]|uniref:RING-type E3 ubiquitin transferase n=1 Tax=Oncorhynchus mykiss TaxID=8022 RepID=A0A060XBT4_ONCMY|nr:unnamed protein product [Oncorhynchus mykiss]